MATKVSGEHIQFKGSQAEGQTREGGVAQFELYISQGVIPKNPRFCQRAEGSPVAHSVVAGDPSLRLKNGYVQDDAIDERSPPS
jgi:hypothetical protein